MTRDEIYCADEAFLAGTAAGVTPVRELDGRRLGAAPGPLTERLRGMYEDCIRGRASDRESWLSWV